MAVGIGTLRPYYGASRGLGAAIARRLAEEGARVVVSARTLERGQRDHGSLRDTVDAITAADQILSTFSGKLLPSGIRITS